MSAVAVQSHATRKLGRENLRDYQLRAASHVLAHPRCALWVDMGLGKTISVLTAIQDLKDSLSMRRALVIAPKRVCEYTWPDEVATWSHLDLKVQVVSGTATQRLLQLSLDADVHIINRELVDWLMKNVTPGKWRWDVVVVDESSSFKSAKTKRWKALRKIVWGYQAKTAVQVERLVQLTGTPASNGLMDVWAQMYLLDQGEALGRTVTDYKRMYFSPSGYMGYGAEIKKGAEETIHERLQDDGLILRLAKEDWLDLPETIYTNVPVSIPESARKVYTGLEKDFLAELADGPDIEAFNAAALTQKLRQCCAGAIYDEHHDAHEVHTAKLEALADILDENTGENLLVSYEFKSDAARIKKKFGDLAVEIREKGAIERWNRGEIRMLLAHPASAGHGLNLQGGGRTVVHFSLNWSLELYSQINERVGATRQVQSGDPKPVRYFHLVVPDTYDELVLEALHDKDATQKGLLAAVKAQAQQHTMRLAA